MSVRVRFAPSPTGFLHIGGARTALFNWLYAKSQGGKFLLRIEDTDRERSEDRFVADIMESMRWLGLNWDEEPVYQHKRFPRYQEIAEGMIAKGQAFRCDCTAEQLDAIRAQCEKDKKPFRYPGTCRTKNLPKGSGVVRIKSFGEGETGFTDLIRGNITFQNKDIDDWVILRTDGSPTYNFCVVIDDSDQEITHILRGDDHINNTPKQVQLYQMLERKVPFFAHLPMILGADKTKLSKRHGAASTLEYRVQGYLPEALTNFLVRLGWSHGDQEILSTEEMCKFFSLEKIGKSNAVFNPEKLNWLSGQYFTNKPTKDLVAYLHKYFAKELEFTKGVEPARFEQGVKIVQGKVKNILELIDQLGCLFGPDPDFATLPATPEERKVMADNLRMLLPLINDGPYVAADMEQRVKAKVTERGEKLGPYAKSLRFAVTGGKISPGLFEMLEVQGQSTVNRRVEKVLSLL